jgi:putative membrane protein
MKKVYLFIILTLVPLLSMCSGPYEPMRDGYGGYGMGPGMMGGYGYGYGGMFMGILFLILAGVAIYYIVQSVRSKSGVGHANESHIDILKKRYAKGEVTKEDFDRMKNDLQ